MIVTATIVVGVTLARVMGHVECNRFNPVWQVCTIRGDGDPHEPVRPSSNPPSNDGKDHGQGHGKGHDKK